MAYQGRKPLTNEQRAQRANDYGGLLSQDEQSRIIELVRGGEIPSLAIKQIGRSPQTLINTEDLDPEFEKELLQAKRQGIGERLEDSLILAALGLVKRTKKRWVAKTIKGDKQYDEKGEQIMQLAFIEDDYIPVERAAKMWLEAHKPELYRPMQRIELNTLERYESPEQFASRLAGLAHSLGISDDSDNEPEDAK
jgi:hypothetical protein